VAKGLLEYETLTAEEIRALIRGEPIRTGDGESPPQSKPRSSVPSSGRPAKDETSDRKRPGGLEPEPQPGA
jgi:cell division protease FtsH